MYLIIDFHKNLQLALTANLWGQSGNTHIMTMMWLTKQQSLRNVKCAQV